MSLAFKIQCNVVVQQGLPVPAYVQDDGSCETGGGDQFKVDILGAVVKA